MATASYMLSRFVRGSSRGQDNHLNMSNNSQNGLITPSNSTIYSEINGGPRTTSSTPYHPLMSSSSGGTQTTRMSSRSSSIQTINSRPGNSNQEMYNMTRNGLNIPRSNLSSNEFNARPGSSSSSLPALPPRPSWGSQVSNASSNNTHRAQTTQTDNAATAAKASHGLKNVGIGLGVAHVASSAISTGGGLIQTGMHQQFQKNMISKHTEALNQAGLPSYLAFGHSGSNLPKTSQMVSGTHSYNSQIPGNPASSNYVGGAAQNAAGWGGI